MTHEHVHVEVFGSGPHKRISEPHRFALLVLGVFGAICCSFGYAFNLISGEMQKRYKLSQRDLSIIVTVGLVFQFFLLPYGFVFDHFGPIPIAIFGIVYSALGCVLLALCFNGAIEGSVVRLSVFNAFMGTACSMYDIVVSVTVVSYFPTRKGIVVAFLKSFTGLGTALISSVYSGFLDGHADWYFFLLMAIDVVVALLFVVFMRLPPYHLTGYQQTHLSVEERQKRVATKVQYMRQDPPVICFYYGLVILIIMIIYLPLEGALVAYLHLGTQYKVAFAVVTIVLTFAFIIVAYPLSLLRRFYPKDKHAVAESESDIDQIVEAQDHYASKHDPEEPSTNHEPSSTTQHTNAAAKNASTALPDTELDYIAPQYQVTFQQGICTTDLWALWWSMFGIMGGQLIAIYNSTYIVGALSSAAPDDNERALLSVLNGVGSAVGRLLMAGFETWIQSRKVEERVPITYALFVPTSLTILSNVLLLALPAQVLPLAFAVSALGNGFCAAVIILVVRTLYAKDIAKLYNIVMSAAAISAIIYVRFLYGEWYSVQAERLQSENGVCLHRVCVVMPIAVLLGMSCSSLLTNLFVHIRYARFCREALAERARVRQQAQAAMDGEVHSATEAEQQPAEQHSRET